MRRRARRTVAVLAVAGIVSTTGACSKPLSDRPADEPDLSQFVDAGPWAADFASAFADAGAYERAVLHDGVITSAERADAHTRLAACMRDAGWRWTEHDDGSAEGEPLRSGAATDVEDMSRHLEECSKRWDKNISLLFEQIRRNPAKRDEAKISVTCLRHAGVVGSSYSERQWRSEDDSGVFSFDEWSPAAVHCREDPLGLWRTP